MAAPGVSEFRYLGIPDSEEYPNTSFRLESRVPEKYYRVSRLTHVSESDFQRDLKQGKLLFPEKREGTEYYATEVSAHVEQQAGVREWVTILQRKAYP